MTDKQDAIVEMYQEVVSFFHQTEKKATDDTILKKHVKEFSAIVTDIETYHQAQEFDSKGYTIKKNKAKESLSITIYKLSSGFCSFGIDTNNQPIVAEFKTSQSHVNKKSDADFVNYANQLATSLGEHIKELTPYHITADNLTNLITQTTNYSDILHIPDQVTKNKAVATDKIKELISDGRDLLENSIDRDMVYYKDKQEDWYNEYLKRREIDDSQTTALSIKGKVTEAHEPVHVLQYVTVTAKFKAGAELSNKVKMTTALGNYQFKGIPDGKCTITFEKDYYQTLVVESEVHHQKATQLDVEMKKVE